MSSDGSFRLYAENAATLAQKFERVSAAEHLVPVIDLFPAPPAKIADIGAGSGRDAAWLVSQGYQVVAAEPVAELRAEGHARHASVAIEWLDDGLPQLKVLRGHAPFDVVLLSGVWHHIAPDDRDGTMKSLAAVLNPGGLVVIAMRLGPTDPDQGLYDADQAHVLAAGEPAGFQQLAHRVVKSAEQGDQAKGGLGSWLVLRRG